MSDLTNKQLYTLGDSIYLLSDVGTWNEAQTEALSFGANLVTINDTKEQTFLAGLFAAQGPWIGLNDADVEGTFSWISGETFDYRNWEGGQPDNFRNNEDFAVIGGNSSWYDVPQTDQRRGIIEIKDPTIPILVIEDLGIIEPAIGTKEVLFKVKLFGNSSEQITVDYATADDTAFAGSNYTATSGTLTFEPGETEKLISVTISNDQETLSGKQFFVELTSPVNAILGDNQSTATIHEAQDAVTFGGSTYILSQLGTWGDAQVEAQSFGGHLTTIEDAAEAAFLAGVYADKSPWIGLSDAGEEGGGDPNIGRRKFEWFNGTTAYSNWEGGQPDNFRNNEDFAAIGGNSSWYDQPQTDIRRGIIEIPTPLSVPIPDMTEQQIYTLGDSIYLLSNAGTWGAAQVEAQSFQGNLVTINDAKEQTFLAGLFADQGPWIGLNDAGQEGTFSWISGETFDYRNWEGGQPDNFRNNEDFAFLGGNSSWYDTFQTNNRQGLIEINNPTIPILVIQDLGIIEPESGTKEAVFIVRRFGNNSNAISVNYSTEDGTALAGTNYTATSGILTFEAGQMLKTISVNIAEDADTETAENFFLNLSNPTNGTILGDKQAQATIREATDASSSGNSSYLLTNAKNWGQAQVEAQSFGGSLTTINNADEQNFLAAQYASQSPWIGLSDAGEEGGGNANIARTKFEWFNGRTVYSNWQPGQPDNFRNNEDFAFMGTNGNWYDTYQTHNRQGIVEIANSVNQVGTTGDDFLYGSEGDDDLDGRAGNDNLIGKAGNDNLIGKAGNDNLIGNSGNDTLQGTNGGSGEVDILEGGDGDDLFILGNADFLGYDDGDNTSAGLDDYALINDFNLSEDKIQLRGWSNGYLLMLDGTDTNLYINKPGNEPNELIAIIKNQTGLSLTANYFSYVYSDSNPTDIHLDNNTVDENQPINTNVGSFRTSDDDPGDTFTYSLVAGNGDRDNSLFTIDGNSLKTNAILDYESQQSYSIRVQTTDSANNTYAETLTILVNDLNDSPTDINLDNNTVDENQPINTNVGSFSTTDIDPGDTFTYSLVAGNGDRDNSLFTIDGNSLKTNAIFDYESQQSYSIRVQTTDSANNTYAETLTILVNDLNDSNVSPTDINLDNNTVDETQPINTTVGSFSTTDIDPGETFTYSLVAGDGDSDNSLFIIDGNTLKTNAIFNYESQQSYSIRVQTKDSANNTYSETLTINVNNLNEYAPKQLQFGVSIEGNTLNLTNGWIHDEDGYQNLNYVDLWVKKDGGNWENIADITTFNPWQNNNNWASFNHEIDLSNYAEGTYKLWAQGYDQEGLTSNIITKTFQVEEVNIDPDKLQFQTNRQNYKPTETLVLENAWVYDEDGSSDVANVDFWVKTPAGEWIDVGDANSFTPWQPNTNWVSIEYSLNLRELQGSGLGNHTLWGQATDSSGAKSNVVTQTFSVDNIAPSPTGFAGLFDIDRQVYSSDDTLQINNGWVRDLNGVADIQRIDFWLRKDNTWQDIEDILGNEITPWSPDTTWGSFDFDFDLTGLTPGNYTLWSGVQDETLANNGTWANIVSNNFEIQ